MGDDIDEGTAFEFSGSWKEFLPIALTNLLLTIVTLGLYRFWATTRERRYFWSRTRFIDDRLEWTGTGLELLIGFVVVLALVFVPLFVMQFVVQGLILRGHAAAAFALGGLIYGALFYLFGIAKFRVLRYRLSRTYWHGIRGGSDDQGFAYGWSYMWKTVIGFLALGLLIPWSMTKLWNERWNAMSFGDHRFESNAFWGSIFLRFIICYAAPWVLMIGLGIAMIPIAMAMGNASGAGVMILIFGVFGAIYIALPLFALAFYAAFLREAVGAVKLSEIGFAFTARTKHWLLLFLGNLGIWLIAAIIAIVPLAAFGVFSGFADLQPGRDPFAGNRAAFFGMIAAIALPIALVGPFIRYRTWRFGVNYLEATGEVDLDRLTQSSTRQPGQGEGLLDAFDVGAL
ncbi:YjgN family protein [Sphingobium boeckii]|uniref:Uncharacterized membrane protein YjgN (DUF898 family) n=1 Tax=Sphingobium boeckii TaxID=1082345 RepID=A0A7W9EE63_9SPHN|nr:YjgN family protein [Sphingobium boeckii]MBB5684351.1 uncharacterized membrane protein YjgN (DUF898 family) [Sphingobium boeckii]